MSDPNQNPDTDLGDAAEELGPIAQAEQEWREAQAEAERAADFAKAKRADYDALISAQGFAQQDDHYTATQHYFARIDAQAAARAREDASVDKALNEALAKAPSTLDASKALQAKTKKRAPQTPKE